MAANSRFAVATHLMTGLSLQDSEKWISSSYLASSVNTNPVVVRRILLDLQRASLITTLPGKSGGAKLSRPADQITLYDIYAALQEGPLFAFNPSKPNKKCPLSCSMKDLIRPVFDQAEQAVTERFKKIKLSHIGQKLKE